MERIGHFESVLAVGVLGVPRSFAHILVLQRARDFHGNAAVFLAFLRGLKERGLKGVELFVSDKCLGLVENLADFYPEAKWQRCVVHFYRNVWTAVPTGKVKEVAAGVPGRQLSALLSVL